MKILHIVSNISLRNGIMSILMNYYRNIDRNEVSFDFVYFDEREFTHKEEIERLGGKVYKIKRYRNPLILFLEINKFLKKHVTDYQIIQIHEIYLISTLIGIKKRNSNLKIIAHAHATDFSSNKLKAIRNKIMSFPSKIIPDYYCACSVVAGNAIFGKKFTRKGHVINNAIDLSKFKVDNTFRNEIREQLGISDKYVIGHVGNFNKHKNHFFLLDIFYELQKEKDSAVLVLIGDGERREKVLAKCKKIGISNKIIYLGVRNDINKIMNCFDCFVLPSISEGLGIVLIEAQASGKPCVFSNAVPEEANILKQSNMILPLCNNVKMWANSIVKCEKISIDKPYEKISKAGYNIKLEAKKLEEYYKRVIGKSNN